MQGLILHCGGKEVEREALSRIVTPEPTETHFPIPHVELLDSVIEQTDNFGYDITAEGHGLTRDGSRYFGMLEVKPRNDLGLGTYEDRSLLIGLRNSHDKSFLAAIALGTRVFVCDNMSFSGETVVGRKHTRFIHRDLDRIVNQAFGKLGEHRERQDRRIACYKETNLRDADMNDLMVRAMNAKVIPCQGIAHVQQEWHEPEHEEFQPRSVWSAFNAFTSYLKGRHDLSRRTQILHGLCDLKAGCAV